MTPDSYLSSVTVGWILPRVVAGALIGYVLRVVEHFIWWRGVPEKQVPLGSIAKFNIAILPESILFGVVFGCLFLGIVGLYFGNSAFFALGAFSFPAMMSFLANDFRDLIRRMKDLR
jgi:hypothetical protein